MMKVHAELVENKAMKGERGREADSISMEQNIKQDEASCLNKRAQSLRTRYVYGILFFKAILWAWIVRDYGHKFFHRLLPESGCGVDKDKCLHAAGVLRVSLGCFMFFMFMTVTTCGIYNLHEARNSWHSRWWTLKLTAYVFFTVATFVIPADVIQIYGEVARIGAGIFLLLQLISLIHFLSWCNNRWMRDTQLEKCSLVGLFFSTIFCLGSFFGILLMYFIYASDSSCSINIFLIACTAILVVVMIVTSLHPKVNTGLLSSSIMGVYIVFLCWSAIQSEPQTEECSKRMKLAHENDTITIMSFFFAISAILMATFSTGIDSRAFQFRKLEPQSEDDIPYKYSTFHLVFSLGAMYFAMLLISWKLEHPTKRWKIDVGWTSTWVKTINQWLAVIIYLWKLLLLSPRNDTRREQEEEPVQDIGLTV